MPLARRRAASPAVRPSSEVPMLRIRLAVVAGALALTAGLSSAQQFGDLKGQVKLSKAPPPGQVNVTTDKEHCLSKGPLKAEDVLVSKDGGLKNVIVFLRPDTPDRKAEFPKDAIHPALKNPKSATIEIDQPCCQFTP